MGRRHHRRGCGRSGDRDLHALRQSAALGRSCSTAARRIGAKILVSGGGRCNVTNTVVTERDYWGGAPTIVRRVLRAFPAARPSRSSNEPAYPARGGRRQALSGLEPRARRARRAAQRSADAAGVVLRTGQRVTSLVRRDDGCSRSTAAAEAILRAHGRARHRRTIVAEDRQRRWRLCDRAGARAFARADDAGSCAARARDWHACTRQSPASRSMRS